MCFHVSRKCLTPGPFLTSNLGCQRHFLECPVKMNMWTETGGLRTPARRARGPSWHRCPATPFASYANIRLYKIKGLYMNLYLLMSCEGNIHISLWGVRTWELEIRKVYLCHHQQVCFCSAFMFRASVTLCAKNCHLVYFLRR